MRLVLPSRDSESEKKESKMFTHISTKIIKV